LSEVTAVGCRREVCTSLPQFWGGSRFWDLGFNVTLISDRLSSFTAIGRGSCDILM